MKQQTYQKNMDKIPTGVKIISFLYYINAAIQLVAGIFFLFFMKYLSVDSPEFLLLNNLGNRLYIGVILILLLSVFYFYIGKELWKGKNWARIVTIVFMAVLLISGILNIVLGEFMVGLFGLVVGGIIASYLIFNKKVKKAFS